MKNRLLLLPVFIMLSLSAFTQAPLTIPYQAVARDAAGNLIQSQTICVEFRIYTVSSGGTPVFEEYFKPTTSPLGLFNVSIGLNGVGGGTVDIGSNLSFIQSGGTAYTEVYINSNSNCSGSWTLLGARTQMQSVPYALYAGNAASTTGSAGGDLSGAYPNPSVVKIQGVGVTATPTPVTGQVMEFNGTNWTPATTMGNVTSATTVTGSSVDISGTTSINTSGSATTTLGNTSSTTTVAGPASLNDGLTETGNVTITTLSGGNVVINDPSPSASAVLDLYSTTQGFLPPRVTTAQEAAISNPANGIDGL